MDPALKSALYAIAYYQARRENSVFELKKKMSRRHDPKIIDQAIEIFKQKQLLKSETDLAQLWADSLARKNKSQSYIRNYLKKHKLPTEMTFDSDAEVQKAKTLILHKYQKKWPLDKETTLKAKRFLFQKGFSYDVIRKAFHQIQED